MQQHSSRGEVNLPISSLLSSRASKILPQVTTTEERLSTHLEMESSPESALCLQCASIDLFPPTRKSGEERHAIILRDVKPDFKSSREISCPLCDIILWLLGAVPHEIQNHDLVLTVGRIGYEIMVDNSDW